MNNVKVTMLKNQTIDNVVYKRNRSYLLAADKVQELVDAKVLIADSMTQSKDTAEEKQPSKKA